MGTDLDVANAARVSHANESEWKDWFELPEGDERLIHFLARKAHKSPFNHCFVSFRVKAPIFVARQLVKHEYLPWNEVSRRYVEDDLEFYFPDSGDWRSQPANVKQGSGEPLGEEVVENIEKHYSFLVNDAINLYQMAIKEGLSREQARMFLPQSLMTEWIWSGSLYAFAKMCNLRMGEHAQKESMYVAREIHHHLWELFPVSTEALMKYVGNHG